MLTPSLLKLLLLTRQAAEHGAVEPRRNELPSFRARRGLSIVPTFPPDLEKSGGVGRPTPPDFFLRQIDFFPLFTA